MSFARPVLVEVSPGELFDKLTVLQVKLRRLVDPDKLANIQTELIALQHARDTSVSRCAGLDELVTALFAVNAELFDVIADIYKCEASADWGDRFIYLARSVYRLNDSRALLKREINLLLGSRLVEEKAHLPSSPSTGAETSPSATSHVPDPHPLQV